MTIEQLQEIASGMYQISEDAIPGSNLESKDDFMARKIEHAIQHKTPLLKQLLAAQNRIEMYRLLRRDYEDETYGNRDF